MGLYVGAISGTSVDGLDLALVAVDNRTISLHRSDTVALPQALREQLLALGQPYGDNLDTLGTTDRALGEFIGVAVLDFLDRCDTRPATVTAIGSHGQTVRHRPGGQHPFTLQIGDPNQIAELTGITCVADFRRRDMAAGGEGAPLVPPFHAALFRQKGVERVVLNIGGIANVSLLPADAALPVTGFDTGPGNALLDSWTAEHRQQPFDADGAWAASGTHESKLLDALLRDPYLTAAPPKSTGREHYNLEWLRQHAELANVAQADVQATLLEFTCRTIADAISRWAPGCEQVLVCGGGSHNGALMRRLAGLLTVPVVTTDAHGMDGDAIEAAAFAWLAAQTLGNAAGNEPAVTGARGARVLGGIYPAGNDLKG